MDALLTEGDRLRRALLQLGVRYARPIVVSRERRVAVVLVTAVLSALAGAALIPLWMILLGPLLWGVPHLLADLRYLVARERRARKLQLAALVGAACLGLALGHGLSAALWACGAAATVSRGAPGRRVAIAVAAMVAGALAWPLGAWGDLGFIHAHNVIAVLMFWAWRRRNTSLHLLGLVAFTVASAVLLGGLPELTAPLTASLAAPLAALPTAPLVHALTGSPAGPWTARLLAFFAFGQAVHYVIWLRLIPEDDRARPAPPTLRTGYAKLRAELPLLVLAPAAALALGLLGWGAFDPVGARQGYVMAASFHGYLELIAGAFWLAEGRRPAQGRGR